MPDKEAIIQTNSRLRVDKVSNQRVRVIKMLQKCNVDVIDLVTPFMADNQKDVLFQKKDAHWDGQGILIAARVVSDSINCLLGVSGQSRYSYKDTCIFEPRDLAMLLGDSSSYPCACRMITTQEGSPFKDSVWSDIMIFGDSFSEVSRAFGGGIGAQIAYFTNRPTFTIAHIHSTRKAR